MIDLQATYEAGLVKLHERNARGDEALLHIGGDLAGMCDRAAWARRKYHSGKLVWDVLTGGWVNPYEELRSVPPDAKSIASMQLGFKAEELILDGIERGLPEGFSLARNVHAALVLTEEGLHGKLFPDDVTDAAIAYAEDHAGVAIGHIDGIVHDADWTNAVVLDAKSTVWSDSWKTGERVWTQKYPPKESHELQVAAYALVVSLHHRFCTVRAGLLELDLGGKGTRWSEVDWRAKGELIEARMRECGSRTNPENDAPEPKPNPWTIKRDGTSWACGAVVAGKVSRGYCGQTSCPAHVLNHGES